MRTKRSLKFGSPEESNTPTKKEKITPTWIYAIIGIGCALAVVVIVLIVLIVRTRRPRF